MLVISGSLGLFVFVDMLCYSDSNRDGHFLFLFVLHHFCYCSLVKLMGVDWYEDRLHCVQGFEDILHCFSLS